MLAVLLRDCTHSGTTTDASNIRYALKCDTFSVQIAKTPIQIPIPQQSPELVDLGIFRPSISIGGLVDTIGQDTTTTVVGFEDMEKMTISRKNNSGSETAAIYYIPYKNKLEEFVYKSIYASDKKLEIEIGDAEFPIFDRYVEGGNASDDKETGGGFYEVAIQQARFQVDPSTEDRWQFQMQFVCTARKDVSF